MLPVVMLLLLHVIHRERHRCIGCRLDWGPGRTAGHRLSDFGHCALIADRTDLVVLLHVSHAGCMSKKVCNGTVFAVGFWVGARNWGKHSKRRKIRLDEVEKFARRFSMACLDGEIMCL